MPDMCDFQEPLNLALEPPPDSWAAHIDELPTPSSHVFAAQSALALALIYASTDPDVRQQLDNLRKDIQELASQNEVLDAYAKTIYEVACQSQQEVSKLHNETLSLSQMVKTLAKQLEDAQTEILDANERVHGALEKRAASTAESKDLRRQLQEAISELQTVASERDAGKMKLQQAELAKEGELERLRAVISQLEADVKLLSEEKVAKCAELAEAQNVVSSLEDANAKLVSELAVVNTTHDVLAESKDQLQSDLRAAHEESHVLQEQLRHAGSQHAELEADRDNLRSKGAQLQAQIGELIDGRDSLAEENTALRWTLRVVHDRKVVQTDRLRDVESKRVALQAECDDLRSSCADARAALDKLTGERDLLAGAHITLHGDYRDLQDENVALSLQLREAETQRKTLETERDAFAAARATLEKEGGALRDELAEMQSTCEALRSRLTRDRESFESALHDAQQTGAACLSQFPAAEAEVEHPQRELEAKCQSVEECTCKLRDAERERGALPKELETVRTDLSALQNSGRDQKLLSNQETSDSPEEVKQNGESQIIHLHNSIAFGKAKFNATISTLSAEQKKRETLETEFRAEREEASRTLADTRKVADEWKRDARAEQDVLSQKQAALSKERDTLICQRDALTARLDSLQAELRGARAQFKASNEESTARITDLVTQLEGLGHTNAGHSSTLLVGQTGNWQRRFQIALSERDRALEQRDALDKAQDQLRQDTKAAVEKAAKRQAESRKALIAERKKVADERDKAVAERHVITGERDKAISERDAIIAERDNIAEERRKVAAQYKIAYESLVAEQTMRRDAQQLHSDATEQLQYQEKQVKQLSSQVTELQKRLKVKEQLSHTRQLQEEISKLKRDLAATKTAYTQARFQAQQVEQMRNDLVQEASKSAQAQIKNLDLEGRVKSTKQENAKLTQKIEKLNRYIHDLRKRVDELKDVRAENERLCNQIDELENPKHKISRSA